MNRAVDRSATSLGFQRAGWACLAIVATALAATSEANAQYVTTNHLREAVRSGAAQPLGSLPEAQVMSLDLVLPLRDPAALENFLADVYNPSSSSYRHFLTVAEFTAEFGPTEADYAAVVSFAKSHGLTVTGGSRDGMEVQVKGTVAAVENAFHVNMLNYQHPTEDRAFFAPDREPTTTLSFPLWHISGLSNYSTP